jgi:uncharacterized circularly permuted ATP-grasp superfamily protein/uncharacterized alpha-E superfamily protein
MSSPIPTQSQSQSSGLAFTPPLPLNLYPYPTHGADELRTSEQNLQLYWEQFFQAIPDLMSEEFARRWREAEYLIRENGVTYNVYGDPKGLNRPWHLDPIPAIIPALEAEFLEAALIQRATLLERLYDDIYGDQRLLRDGSLPPELVYANPGYLRPCRGIRLPLGRSLHLYGASLGRGPNGQWLHMGDRNQAPSGAGYALENRIVVSRIFPEAFRMCRVQRIAHFFQTFLDTVRSIAPCHCDNPRIVLLTPGPKNETYFEQSYLARYLGCTLVEGSDLTVRDDRVFLKVLGGLQPVDVILRRVDDAFCDPLELRADSFLGVAGLLNAVRCGNVAVANALGTSVLDCTALDAYLPQLCRTLLGEDLRLPAPSTWWCGERRQRDYVLAHLDELVIKSSFAGTHQELVIVDRLSRTARTELADRIRSQPHLYVGQARATLSTCPVYENGQLVPRQMIFRTYLTATPHGFSMMPGGLTRVAADQDELTISMQRGGGSKDTWVLAEGHINTFTRLPDRNAPVVVNRGGGELPSRIADNLFWLGRYAERAESMCRMLRGILGRLTERTDGLEIPALLRSIGSAYGVGVGPNAKSAIDSLFDAEQELLGLIFDPQRVGSVANVASKLHGITGLVRDRISPDMWRVVNGIRFPRLNPEANQRLKSEQFTTGDALDALDRTIVQLAAFGGLASESMTRTDGWRFLDLGRKIERAIQMVNLLRGTLVVPSDPEGPVLDAVLDIADSRITYRRRYLVALRIEAVLDLLMLDDSNPRSFINQLRAFAVNAEQLPKLADRGECVADLAGAVLKDVESINVARLCLISHNTRPALAEWFQRLLTALPNLSEILSRQYLTHLTKTRHLALDEETRP